MNKIYQSRAEALLAVDEMIGNLLDQIEAMKVQDKTFVFFSW
jgi:arylsulfatase A-like enzyme